MVADRRDSDRVAAAGLRLTEADRTGICTAVQGNADRHRTNTPSKPVRQQFLDNVHMRRHVLGWKASRGMNVRKLSRECRMKDTGTILLVGT
jgi:hypothetical protein